MDVLPRRARRARVRTKARDLLGPVAPESDALVEGLHGVAAGAAPVDVRANVHTADGTFLHVPSATAVGATKAIADLKLGAVRSGRSADGTCRQRHAIPADSVLPVALLDG